MTERLQISNYQPTPSEVKRLEKEGLSLAKVLEYNQPREKDFARIQEIQPGSGLVDAILATDLRANISDILNQQVALTNPEFPADESDIANSQAKSIRILSLRLEGNPYPGRGFSKEKGQLVLEALKSQHWNSQSLPTCLKTLRNMLIVQE